MLSLREGSFFSGDEYTGLVFLVFLVCVCVVVVGGGGGGLNKIISFVTIY